MVQQVVKKKILHCRMVRDNPEKKFAQSRQQSVTAEAQSQSQSQAPEEPVGLEQSPEGVKGDSQEPTERQLDILHWSKLNLREEAETWQQVSIPRTPDLQFVPLIASVLY